MKNSRLGSLAVLAVYIPAAGAHTAPASPRPAPAAAAPTVAYLDDDTVAALQSFATGKHSPGPTHFSLNEYDGDSLKLLVTSARAAIVQKTAETVASGGRYRPLREQRRDVVLISCGDEDLGERFDCSSLRVKVGGKILKPISYTSGPNNYRNAMGASWTVLEASAVYPARPLTGGFLVDYASPDGREWTFEVSADDAVSKLLLTFDPKTYAAETVAREKAAAEERAAREREAAEKKAAKERADAERPDVEIARLESASAFERLSAATWFADAPTLPPAKAVPALAKAAVSDRQWGVQIAALRALQRMGPAALEACPALATALKTAAGNIAPQLEAAHKAVCGRP